MSRIHFGVLRFFNGNGSRSCRDCCFPGRSLKREQRRHQRHRAPFELLLILASRCLRCATGGNKERTAAQQIGRADPQPKLQRPPPRRGLRPEPFKRSGRGLLTLLFFIPSKEDSASAPGTTAAASHIEWQCKTIGGIN